MLLIDAGELDRIGRRVFAAAGSAEGEAVQPSNRSRHAPAAGRGGVCGSVVTPIGTR